MALLCFWWSSSGQSYWYTVYPKKYAHGFCFAVLCCGYTLTDFPISIRLTSLALWQSNDCPSASKATLMNMDKYFMWIHYYDCITTTKQSTTKPCAYFLGYTVLQVYFTGTVARVPMKQPWRIWVKASHQSTRTDVFNKPQHNVYIFVACNTRNWLLIMLL